MRVAFYHSNRDNVPKSADLTWGQLVEILTQHQPTDCAPCAGHDCPKKFGRAWSPVDIETRRKGEYVKSFGALVLDFDGLSREQAADVGRRVVPFTHIAYSTHSWNPDQGLFAFRAVIQLTRSVPAAQWRGFLSNAIGYLGVPADPSCKDLSRLYFLPTAPIGGPKPFGIQHVASALDVDAVLALKTIALDSPPVTVRAPIEPCTVDLSELQKRIRSVNNEASREMAKAILAGSPLGFSEMQRRSGSPQIGRDHGLQRAASLVAWACPLGTPVPALFELLRPSFGAMDLTPEGADHWYEELIDMLERAVERKADTEAREEAAHKALLNDVFDFTPGGIPVAEGVSASMPEPAIPAAGPALSAGDLLDDLTSIEHAPLPKPEEVLWSSQLIYRQDKDGNEAGLKSCLANARTILLYDKNWKNQIRRNLFTGGTELWGGPIFSTQLSKPIPLTDEHVTKIAAWMQQRPEVYLRMDMSTAQLYEIIQSVAVESEYNPLREYLDACAWDGVNRLDTWLEKYLGAKTTGAGGDDITQYIRAVASKWLIAAVARTYEPGCKVQNVLILEGDQGLRKSTTFEVLASREFFTDSALDIGNKDTSIMTTRTWIVELAELDAFRKSEHTQAKAFFTRDWEEYRPPYGRTVVKRPRVCIFAGTSNRDDYLTDPTGNRRYWPVICTKIDLQSLSADRDQLWAEAVARYRAGAGSDCLWWLTKEEEEIAYRTTEERVAPDEWEDSILRWWAQISGKTNDVRMSAVLEVAIGIPKERINLAAQMRASAALKRLGFIKKRKREAGRPVWYYVPGAGLAAVPSTGGGDHLTLLPGGGLTAE